MTDTISTAQLAAILGISRQRINELGRKGKISREPNGQWNLVKVHEALRNNLDVRQITPSLSGRHKIPIEPQNTSAPSGEIVAEGTFLEAQRRHEWLKVQKEELALQVRRGELIEKKELERELGALLTAFRNRSMLMPDKLAPRVAVTTDVLECRALIEREVRELLSILSEYQTNAA